VRKNPVCDNLDVAKLVRNNTTWVEL